MKKLFSLSVIIFFFVCCKTQYDVVRKIDKEHRHAPPGTVWLKDSIFIDMCEVRNLDYLEYVHWTKRYDSINYINALPDTLVWREKESYNEPFVNYYFSHSAYRNYPVVGVSYEQAIAFCKWRTERVKEFITLRKHHNTVETTFGAKDLYYRLPTKAEWEYAASAGLDSTHPFGFEQEIVKPNHPNVVYKRQIDGGTAGYLNDSETLFPVIYQKQNKFGLYNTIGNVAEMTMAKGTSKGGSWMNSIADCEITDSIRYESPSSWLGFRCVCVMIK